MGTAPLSKPEAPARPYADRRVGRRLFPVPEAQREPRTLMQLILRQDWQKVLVRAKLFPREIKQPVSIQLYGLLLRLLPLHLVCALDPPVAVVTLFLKLHPEAATIPISSVDDSKSRRSRTLRRPFQALGRYKRRLSSRSIATATSNSGIFRDRTQPNPRQLRRNNDHEVSEQSLLNGHGSRKRALLSRWCSYRHFMPSIGSESRSHAKTDDEDGTRQQYLDHRSAMESMSNSSIASSSRQSSYRHEHDSLVDHKGVILQLSPSGGISPFPIGSHETDSTSETASQPKQGALFGVQWDLTPLWESVANASTPDNSLLAIHIATLYQASPAVLTQLLDVHPMGAVCSVLGMLPIHMACAGWVLEPWVPPPPPLPAANKQPLQPYHHERHPSRLKEILSVLHQVVPESVRIKSGNHSMTPREYISEAMEEGVQKDECLAILEPRDLGEDGTVELLPAGPLDALTELSSTNPSILFIDNVETSQVPWEIHCTSPSLYQLGQKPSKGTTISSLLVSKDWEGALCLAEEDSQHAKAWFYGVDDHLDPTIDDMHSEIGVVWKRLALHLACRYRAPVGLVEVLLDANPQAATSPDPTCGSLPIHLACQHKASYRVVKALLVRAPTTTKLLDKRGRLPLHNAVVARAHYAVVELLVEADPFAALAMDEDKKNPLALAKDAYGRRNVVVRLLEMVTMVLQKSADSLTPIVIKKKRERDTVSF